MLPRTPHALVCIVLLGFGLGAFATPSPARAQVVQPWDHVAGSLEGIYGWPNTLYHLSAVAVTPLLVWSADAPVQKYFQRHDPLGGAFGQASLIGGGFTPIVVPAALYTAGLIAGGDELATAGAAAIQAVVVQFVIVSTLKWLTDRAGPYPDGDPHARRFTSRWLRDSNDPADFDFNPFNLHGGLRWPSGHAASNFALVSALVAFYPDEPWIWAIGYLYAIAISVGMIEGDYHWLSDVLAGALMGQVIGWVIGKRFRAAYDRARSKSTATSTESALQVVPTATPHGLGLALTW